MIHCGISADPSDTLVCSAKAAPDNQAYAGILLFAYGSVPDLYAVADNSKERALQMVLHDLQATAERIWTDGGAQDLRYTAIRFNDCLRQCNQKLYEYSTSLGQGIYIGGVISWLKESGGYIIFPFGGGCAYTWKETTAEQQGKAEDTELIRDALGSRRTWQGQCWSGQLPDNMCLLLTSGLLDGKAIESIRNAAEGHTDLPAMVIKDHVISHDNQAGVISLLKRKLP